MNNLRTIDLIFTVLILALGILMYLHYQEYKPEITTREQVSNFVQEVERYTDIKQLKEKYVDHVQKNFQNHKVVDTLVEYVIYLFAGVLIFLLLSIVVLYKMEKR
jgi:hypothetical protein